MIEENFDTVLKLIVVGNGQVGKTSMIARYAKGVFTNEYKKTLAVDFLEKNTYLNATGEDITFHLWDTAGQEEYDQLTRTYYKGAGACIIAFSTIDRDSFTAVEKWYEKVTAECGNIVIVLVQNKIDLMDDAKMSTHEVEHMAKKLKLKLYRTCVKDNLNIDDVFQHLGEQYVFRGGEAALSGCNAITSIQEHARTPLTDKNDPSSLQNGATSAPVAGTPENGRISGGAKKPLVQRTGGKKSKINCKCSIM
jgi:Ras-related protein Rab-23